MSFNQVERALRLIAICVGVTFLVIDLISPFEELTFIKVMITLLWSLEVLGE